MFEGAANSLFEKAKQLRKNMTDAETVLWMHLKKGIIGYKIRRQHPIGGYIADFYCHKAHLIIEVDGSIHDQPEIKNSDELREKDLMSWGYNILRFNNEQVFLKVDEVLISIREKIYELINLQKLNASSKDGV